MNICCPRCGGLAEPAGHEDARAFFQCPTCSRVWATHISASAIQDLPASTAPRVLIADDSREMLGLLTAWLEDEGCVVVAASSGREAIDSANAYKPDVAFVDTNHDGTPDVAVTDSNHDGTPEQQPVNPYAAS